MSMIEDVNCSARYGPGSSSSSDEKMAIKLNVNGLPIGQNSHQLVSKCGDIVRTHVPITCTDWRLLSESKKELLWSFVQEKFILPQSYKINCLRAMSKQFRNYKVELRKKFLDVYDNDGDRINNCPPGVELKDWVEFVNYHATPKTAEKRQINTENRKQLTINHTTGRHGNARLEEIMKRERLDEDSPITRTDVWIKAHTKKDGSIPPVVTEHIEKIKEIISSGECDLNDISNDPLAQLFGCEKSGFVRAVGSVSKTTLLGSSAAKEKLAKKQRKLKIQKRKIQDLESEVRDLKGVVGDLKAEVGDLRAHLIKIENLLTKGNSNERMAGKCYQTVSQDLLTEENSDERSKRQKSVVTKANSDERSKRRMLITKENSDERSKRQKSVVTKLNSDERSKRQKSVVTKLNSVERSKRPKSVVTKLNSDERSKRRMSTCASSDSESETSSDECQSSRHEVGCELLDSRNAMVATGRVIIEAVPSPVHHRSVAHDELKVVLDTIHMPHCPLPVPNFFAANVGEVGVGGYTVWPGRFVRLSAQVN